MAVDMQVNEIGKNSRSQSEPPEGNFLSNHCMKNPSFCKRNFLKCHLSGEMTDPEMP